MPAQDWDDDLEDSEPDEADEQSGGLVPCPACGEEIYEDSQKCPCCGEYITPSTSPLVGRPWWFCALGLAGVVAVVIYLLR
jgi:hypothetical protein